MIAATVVTPSTPPSAAQRSPDHLSHSQVQEFTLCPRRWRFNKIENAPREQVGSALVFGAAVHDTIAAVNEAALHGERIDAPAHFLTAWKRAVADANAPIHFGKDDGDDLIAKGRSLVGIYTPPPGIIGVEQPFEVELAPDLPIVQGRIDLVRAEGETLILADIKTAAARTLTDTHAVEAQLALYDLAYPASRHEVIVAAKLKNPVITVQPITPWPIATLVRHYREVHHGMASGVRYGVRGWQCEGCSFASRCRKEG
ncbi:MAG: PD-(D/E)XK nuclease family protein [Planctomycetes bacterium]|nr:PD-(D/E)XK nuclease family protein [Planctomycetota bacterium]